MPFGLFLHLRIVCASNQIIYRNIKIIGQLDKLNNSGFSLACFIPTDCILCHIKIHGKS